MDSESLQRKLTISSASRDGRKLILSVDDNMTVLFARFRLLEREGYAVLSASDGVQALQIFGNNPVDLVLLDYSMPGMNGDVVARAMDDQRSVPKILVSGAEVPAQALADVDCHIGKADGPEPLLRAIRELLSSRATTGGDERERAS